MRSQSWTRLAEAFVHTAFTALVGFLRVEGEVEEIFDLQWQSGRRWPELVEPGAELLGAAFQVPDESLGQFFAAPG